ncbi:E3 ubiquitin-protein ligase MPSR1-like [Solanum dulcamara]|uniref:E3 ubiquitin-protein ligase MPSR1-like n=1 Tax=Solanum dulcamara TaxID=45834 RepID=UPI0024852DB1|nr:E3 ubiquitin-protein ligase MPSR1-like [Solanum dulcamara]
MASESESASLMENLMNSRNRDPSLFLPFILSFTNNSNSPNPVQDSSNPDQETRESTTRSEFSDRIILVNPLTQSMVIMETRTSSTLETFMNELMSKEGQPPASKASIDALPSVVICEESEKGECVVCLDELGIGGLVVKEMPCKHRFHGNCVEKWLKIHGSCPICRYKMPEEDGDSNNKSENRGRRREIWMSFSVGNERRSEENGNNQTVSANFSSENEHDHAPEA